MSYLSTRVHFVWSTKQRRPQIKREWQDRLHAYLHGILHNHKSTPLAVGGINDHVHVYCSLPATLSIADLAMTLSDADLVTQLLWAGVHGVAALHITQPDDDRPWCPWLGADALGREMIDLILRGVLLDAGRALVRDAASGAGREAK